MLIRLLGKKLLNGRNLISDKTSNVEKIKYLQTNPIDSCSRIK